MIDLALHEIGQRLETVQSQITSAQGEVGRWTQFLNDAQARVDSLQNLEKSYLELENFIVGRNTTGPFGDGQEVVQI